MASNNNLSMSKNRSRFFKIILSVSLTGSTLVAQNSFADTPDLSTMLTNFSGDIPSLMRLVTAVAYVMGMWFVYRGILELKEFGEQRTQNSSHASLSGPIIQMTVGTLLLYLPSAVQSGLNTFWMYPNPYGYVQETQDQWSFIIQCCYMVIQLIGTISFIRGLLILNQMSESGGGHGAAGRGLTHIIAGVLCINLYDFLNALNLLIGITWQ
jgi:intracellular multiplication protein IcmC